MLFATSLPFWYARTHTSAGMTFTWSLVYEGDFNSYASFIRQSREGHLLFWNQFNCEPHSAAFFNLEFLLVGWLAAVLNLEAGPALQLARAVALIAIIPLFYGLAVATLRRGAVRAAVLVVTFTGGGLGWLELFLPSVVPLHPIDIFTSLHPSSWLQLQPHHLLAQTVSVASLLLFIRGELTGRVRWCAGAAVATAAVAAMRPYDALHLALTSCLFVGVTTLRAKQFHLGATVTRLAPAIGAAFPIAYQAWLFRYHPGFRSWGANAVMPAPEVVGVALGVGLVSIPLFFGLYRAFAMDAGPVPTFLACAVAASILLISSHPIFAFAYQYVTTLMVPGVLLAGWVCEPYAPRAGAWGAWVTVTLLVCVNGLTSAWLYPGMFEGLREGEHYFSTDLLLAYRWLDSHVAAGDVVLAVPENSNRLARYSKASTVAGYRFSTPNFQTKSQATVHFFQKATNDRFRRPLLREYGVRFVVVGPEEREIGRLGSRGLQAANLVPVFKTGDVDIFEVRFVRGSPKASAPPEADASPPPLQ
jgi:hypothetical protein